MMCSNGCIKVYIADGHVACLSILDYPLLYVYTADCIITIFEWMECVCVGAIYFFFTKKRTTNRRNVDAGKQ